jgi:hypothetical protein
MYDATALAELADDGSIEVPPGASSLAFLQAVYRSTEQPMVRRMKAAIAALPYEHPRLAVTVALDGAESWAAQLQRCIARSARADEFRTIEHVPPKPVAPSAQEVSAAALGRPMTLIRRR